MRGGPGIRRKELEWQHQTQGPEAPGVPVGRGGAEELGGDLWRERQARGLQVDRVWRQKRA